MAKKCYNNFGNLRYSAERLAEKKARLRREANNTRPDSARKRNLLRKKIYLTRVKENKAWERLHVSVSEHKRNNIDKEILNILD